MHSHIQYTCKHSGICYLLNSHSLIQQGRPSPWGNDAFPPFQISPFPKKFSDSVENFHNFTFSKKISRFPSAKIFMFFTYFVFFVSPLLWPWCIYASHNTCTGRPCSPSYPYILLSYLTHPSSHSSSSILSDRYNAWLTDIMLDWQADLHI